MLLQNYEKPHMTFSKNKYRIMIMPEVLRIEKIELQTIFHEY